MEIGSKKEPEINQARLEPLIEWALDNFGIYSMDYVPFAGARPMTADMLPVYGPTKNDSTIFIHNGLGHLGLTMAMGTSKLLSQQILARK